jgi:hypothetical protein
MHVEIFNVLGLPLHDTTLGMCYKDVTSRPLGTNQVVLINYYV